MLAQDNIRGKQSNKKKTPGSWTWINSFRSQAPDHLASMALFMFETAARIGQAVKITFKDLDVENKKIWMPAAKGIEAQWVYLSDDLITVLSCLKPRYTWRSNGRKMLSDRLFGYQSRSSTYKTWKRVCKKADIEEIMPHAAGRHGFGTEMMVRQGLDPVTVAAGGRWADTKMLFETYAHPEDTSDKIQKALRTGRVQYEEGKQAKRLKGKKNGEDAN